MEDDKEKKRKKKKNKILVHGGIAVVPADDAQISHQVDHQVQCMWVEYSNTLRQLKKRIGRGVSEFKYVVEYPRKRLVRLPLKPKTNNTD